MTEKSSHIIQQKHRTLPNAADTSLHLALADRLAREIINGTIPEAVAINESMLAQVFKVSRTPARNALLTLVEKGLICALPKRGFVTGQKTNVPHSRLTDYSGCVDSLAETPNSVAQSPSLYEDMEQRISRLSVHGSWRVSIRAAQEHYAVSRGALEYALRKLELNGLVSRRPGGQWIVLKMDCSRLEALFDVRSWLEPKLLEQATPHIPDGVLNKAISLHNSTLERLPQVTGSELDILERVLHHELLVYASNAPGLSALRSVRTGILLSKHVLATDEVPIGTQDPFIEEHVAVLGALKRRSSEESKLRLLAHLLKSREKCAARLERYKHNAQNATCNFAKLLDD